MKSTAVPQTHTRILEGNEEKHMIKNVSQDTIAKIHSPVFKLGGRWFSTKAGEANGLFDLTFTAPSLNGMEIEKIVSQN